MSGSNELISRRALDIKDSITMAISAMAKAMKQEGQDVLSFSAGEPDFPTPEVICDAGVQAIRDGKTTYTASSGTVELRQAIVDKLKRDQGLDYHPSEVIVSNGAKHSIINALLALVDPGDEVIIPAPYWVSYPSQAALAGGTSVILETTSDTEFKVTPDQLRGALTERSKVLILNSPSNPTGSVYTADELAALAEVVVSHPQLVVISDEIYEKLVYGQAKHTSIASFSDAIKARTVVVNGVAKAYSMTGWRIGYAAGPKPIIAAMGRLQSQMTSNPNAPAQWATIDALAMSDGDLEYMRSAFDTRRQLIVSLLNAIDGVSCLEPFGAFYAFPDVSSFYGKSCSSGVIKDSASFCEYLLKEQLVAAVPGSGFGADRNVRFSYATSEEIIREGISRLAAFLESLS